MNAPPAKKGRPITRKDDDAKRLAKRDAAKKYYDWLKEEKTRKKESDSLEKAAMLGPLQSLNINHVTNLTKKLEAARAKIVPVEIIKEVMVDPGTCKHGCTHYPNQRKLLSAQMENQSSKETLQVWGAKLKFYNSLAEEKEEWVETMRVLEEKLATKNTECVSLQRRLVFRRRNSKKKIANLQAQVETFKNKRVLKKELSIKKK